MSIPSSPASWLNLLDQRVPSSNNNNNITASPLPPSTTNDLAFLASTTPTGSIPDEYANNPDFLASQEELRSLLFAITQSTAPTRAGSPEVADAGDRVLTTDTIESDLGCMKVILSTPKRVHFLKNYMAKVAPWLDMFDMQRVFGTQLLSIAQNSPALLYSILALSARQIERTQHISGSYDSLELYQEAIRLLTPLLPLRDPKTLAICTVLCCLEMMSASPRDWRRHLEGCASMFDAFEVHGFSGGLLQAVFWCYARMDCCGALISDGTESTLLDIEKWLPPGTSELEVPALFAENRLPDMHANYAVYLCSSVCRMIADRTSYVELGTENGCDDEVFRQRWHILWQELQQWLENRPVEMVPFKTVPARDNRVFPGIFFLHWAAISSNQLYHTSCILLLQTRPKSVAVLQDHVSSSIWHARRICGISMTNPHEGCLNNAIQPLWVAGRFLAHHREQRELIALIKRIEGDTGWGMAYRIRDLEDWWGTTRTR